MCVVHTATPLACPLRGPHQGVWLHRVNVWSVRALCAHAARSWASAAARTRTAQGALSPLPTLAATHPPFRRVGGGEGHARTSCPTPSTSPAAIPRGHGRTSSASSSCAQQRERTCISVQVFVELPWEFRVPFLVCDPHANDRLVDGTARHINASRQGNSLKPKRENTSKVS